MIPLLLAELDPEALFNATWQTVLVVAGVFAALVAVFSHLKYEDLAEQANRTEQANLTPLDAFRLQVGRFLGTLHKDPPPFTLASLGLSAAPALNEHHGEGAAAAASQELQRRVRARTRASDVVVLTEPLRVGLAMPVDPALTRHVLGRLIDEVDAEMTDLPDGGRIRLQPVAGCALYPLHGGNAEQLRVGAERLLEARLAAGTGPQVSLPPDSPEQFGPAHEAPAATPGGHLDPLTGVLALRELGPALQKFLAIYRKDGLPVSFLYIDVDSLESYNNHYGRAAGDTILKGLCRALERNTRAGDLIGRLEGEEFVVAMNCKPADAVQAAQRLANLIKREQFDFGQNKLRVTVSIGVAGYPDHGAIARLLYERAEMALYDAKARGRNTVSAYAPNMSLPRSRNTRRASAEAY